MPSVMISIFFFTDYLVAVSYKNFLPYSNKTANIFYLARVFSQPAGLQQSGVVLTGSCFNFRCWKSSLFHQLSHLQNAASP